MAWIERSAIVLAIALAGCWSGRGDDSGSSTSSSARATGATCLDFAYQDDAQSYFRTDPKARQLDPDGNGIACEELAKRPRAAGAPVAAVGVAAGLWSGRTSEDPVFTMLVRESGVFWAMRLDDDLRPTEAIIGEGQLRGANFFAEGARRYRLARMRAGEAALSLAVGPGEELRGTLTEAEGAFGIVVAKRPRGEAPAGTYRGALGTLRAVFPARIALDASGRIRASADDGCMFTATLAPATEVAGRTLALETSTSACPGVLRGAREVLVFFDPGRRMLYVAAATPEDVIVFAGVGAGADG